MAKKTNKGIYVAAMLLFLSGLGFLVFSGLSEDSVYFLNVSEALAMPDGEFDQARLFGKVAEGNIVKPEGKLGVSFTIIDKMEPGKKLRVEYVGVVPDTFKPDVEVIVEGRWNPEEKVFKAKSLVTKCPSKYKEKSDAMEQEK